MLLEEARSFIEMMYRELNYNPSIFDKRIKEIEKEIEHTGTYTHTLEELSYGARGNELFQMSFCFCILTNIPNDFASC